jgi:putative chitinase
MAFFLRGQIMKEIRTEQLQAMLGKVRLEDSNTWLIALNGAMAEWQINTPGRQAAFLAQLLHESDCLRLLTENLNYSAARLRQVWPSRFTDERTAQRYAGNPELLANRVYSERMGNGSEASGDGWRYRGRGLIQLTGRNNYQRCGMALGLDLLAKPELLLQPLQAARSAAWFWYAAKLNPLADGAIGTDADKVFERITRAVNGGTNGMSERKKYWDRCREVLMGQA